MAGFSDRSFALLEGLAANNHKDWYAEHRQDFKDHLQEPFAKMLEMTSVLLDGDDPSLRGGKRTMFRQHRDIRFSKDKRPYNTHVSGLLTASGVKDESGGLAYAQITADGGMMACGYYMLTAKQLAPFRDKMIAEPKKWEAVIERIEAAGFAMDMSSQLSSMPRGFSDHKDHALVDYIKLKNLVVTQPLTRKDWTNGNVPNRLVALSKACAPLLRFNPA